MHTLTEPVKHPRLSNFSLKPKLLRSYFFHSDSASADKKEIFRNSSWNFAGKNSTSVFEALTHPCCLVVRFCTIYFFAWLTVRKNKRGALWILKFDHYKPIWRIIMFWRDAVTWWLAGIAQSSAGGGPWDEQHLLGCRTKAAESAHCWTRTLQLLSSPIHRITVSHRAQRCPEMLSATLQLEESFGYCSTLLNGLRSLFALGQWERAEFKKWTFMLNC